MKRTVKVLGMGLALAVILLGLTSQPTEASTVNLTSANVPFTGGPPYGSVEWTADSAAGRDRDDPALLSLSITRCQFAMFLLNPS